ncbi:MAG: ankyrin repeat domain-containing protein, partial [Ottowia sp.]|nr:ankyrin repeat domain-containing protein [Ottowia sp.]
MQTPETLSLLRRVVPALGAALVCSVLTLSPAGAWAEAMPDAEFIALCASGTAEQVKQALAGGANPNARMNGADDDGTTALIAAAQTGSAETVATLLAAGADKNVQDKRGYDALWYANKSAQYGV